MRLLLLERLVEKLRKWQEAGPRRLCPPALGIPWLPMQVHKRVEM